MKTCFTCKQDKPLSSFHRKTSAHSGLAWECRVCVSKRTKLRNAESGRDQRRRWHIQRTYGITWEDYSARFASQNEKCAICLSAIMLSTDKENRNFSAHVDHCHATGQIRGLLCYQCNHGLGLYKDDPELLTRAANYLKANKR